MTHTNKLLIRPAKPDDAHLIAQVVAMAIGDETCLKDYCGNRYIDVLEEIARNENTQYSYRNALIAEKDNAVAGAIVGYNGADLMSLREGTFAIIKKHLGTTPSLNAETEAGEFYLDSIAILPDFRGLGIGNQLLSAMCRKAFLEGHKNIGLLVDFDNPKAEKLYHSVGFSRINPTTFFNHKMWHLQLKKEL